MKIPVSNDTREQIPYVFDPAEFEEFLECRQPGYGDIGLKHPLARNAFDRKGLRDFRSWLMKTKDRRHQIDEAKRLGIKLHIVAECTEAEFWADEYTILKLDNIRRILNGDRMRSVTVLFVGSHRAGNTLVAQALRDEWAGIVAAALSTLP